jgi:hypothetical protein
VDLSKLTSVATSSAWRIDPGNGVKSEIADSRNEASKAYSTSAGWKRCAARLSIAAKAQQMNKTVDERPGVRKSTIPTDRVALQDRGQIEESGPCTIGLRANDGRKKKDEVVTRMHHLAEKFCR